MRNFINKKAKNVKSDRVHRCSVNIDSKVKVEDVKPVVVNAEIIPVPDDIMGKMSTTTVEPYFEQQIDSIEKVFEETPKPKKKKNVKKENKDTK